MNQAKEILAGAYGVQFVIRVSSARMPQNCKGQYRHVAVLCVVRGTQARRISEDDTNVLFIEREWRKVNVGRTERCAYRRALAEARALAAEANATLGARQ